MLYELLAVRYLGPEAIDWDWKLGEVCSADQIAREIEDTLATLKPVLGHDRVIVSIVGYGPAPATPPMDVTDIRAGTDL